MNLPSRRDFLACAGTSIAGITLGGCLFDAPAHKIPSELEQVITHYKDNPAKRKAAEFLIPEAKRRVSQYFDDNGKEDEQHLMRPHEVVDVDALKAGDLIANIDAAFRVRERFPWAKDLDDNTFTHYILPYRNGTNPLDQFPKAQTHWRTLLTTKDGWNRLQELYGVKTSWNELQIALENFTAAYQNTRSNDEKRAVIEHIVKYLNTDLWASKEGICYKPSKAQEKTMEQILQGKSGRCSDLTHFGRMALIAYGIPATTLRIPAWAKNDDNHQVLGVKLGDDWFAVDGTCPSPAKGSAYGYRFNGAVPKVYAEEFGNWDAASKLVKDNRAEHPWHIGFYLGTRSCIDVTKKFTKTADVIVDGLKPNAVTYLSVLNNFGAENLAAVTVEKAGKDGKAAFKDMGCATGILYFSGKDAFLAKDDQTVERLTGNGANKRYELFDLRENSRNQLCRWNNGKFEKTDFLVVTGSGKGIPVELEQNGVYAFEVSFHDSAATRKTSWDRPFVPRKDGTIERY